MKSLAILLGRFLKRFYGHFVLIAGWILWLKDFFTTDQFIQHPQVYYRLTFTAVLLAVVIVKSTLYFRRKDDRAGSEYEISLLALLVMNMVLQFSGEIGPYLYTLNFILLALIAAYSSVAFSLFLAFFLACMVALREWLAGRLLEQAEPILFHFLTSLVFIGFIGQLLLLERKQREKALFTLNKLRRDGSLLEPTGNGEGLERISAAARERSNVDHLFLQDKLLGGLIEIARNALQAQTAVILSLDIDGRNLTIDAMASERDDTEINVAVPLEESIFSAVIATGQPAHLSKIPSHRIPPYYARRPRLLSMIMTPMYRGDHIIGVVAADSPSPDHFGRDEIGFLQIIADQVVENLDNVKVIRNTQHEREQFAAFYEVANKVSSALKIEDVLDVILTASLTIAQYDAAALTLVDEYDPERSLIKNVYNLPEDVYKGQAFKHSEGLVGWVTHIRTYLAHPDLAKVQRPVFAPHLRPKGMKSLLCLPLIIKDRAVGALTFFWKKPNAFSESDRKILEVLTLQASVSLENARIYEKMEEMAITDGLTGLHNHRYFQEWFESEIQRAKRMPIKISMLLMDLDHFKNVNDTYGHPVGDIVLKKAASIIKESIRTVDLAARYGGEEFAIVLLDTDAKGSVKFADRLRKRIQQTRIEYPGGHLSITVSIGISTYPQNAGNKQLLIDLADNALYYSKRTGRNRASHADDVPAPEDMPAPEVSDR